MDKAVENSNDYTKAVAKSLLESANVALLGMTDAQLLAYCHALAWWMGGSRDKVDAFVVDEITTSSAELTAYWVFGKAIGALTAVKPSADSSGPPDIRGWLRPIADIRHIQLLADVRQDSFSHEFDLRPDVILHFGPEDDPVTINGSGVNEEKARKRIQDFATKIRNIFVDHPPTADVLTA